MIEIRFHGLGGQGVVSTSHLLSKAAMKRGKWSHSFPFFTTAMRGGLVTAFTRIDDAQIDKRCFVYNPDLLVVFRQEMLTSEEVIGGINPEGFIVINAEESRTKFPPGFHGELFTLNASKIAKEEIGRPILSTAIVGAVVKVLDLIPLDALHEAISEDFEGDLRSANIRAADRAFQEVMKVVEEK